MLFLSVTTMIVMDTVRGIGNRLSAGNHACAGYVRRDMGRIWPLAMPPGSSAPGFPTSFFWKR